MKQLALLTTLLAVLVLAGSAAAAPITSNLVHLFDAAADDGSDGQWNDGIVGGDDPAYDLTGVSRIAVSGSATTLTYAYGNDGTGSIRTDQKSGDFSDLDDSTNTTFEMWVRVNDLSGLAAGEYMTLLDFGGGGNGAGMYLYNDGDDVVVQARPSTGDVLASAPLTSAQLGDFMQVVMSIDPAADSYSLYVNATGSSASLAVENFGSNATGLGSQEGQAGGIPDTGIATDTLVGDIALVRMYEGKALSAAEVTQNYNDVIPEPATMSLLAIGGLGALLRRKR